MINSWWIVKRVFIAAWSLLGFAEFRKGRHGLLYVVRFLSTVVETTISGSNLSAFDVSTETAIVALEDRLPPNALGAYITLGRQQSTSEYAFEWVPSHLPRRRASRG